jgi:hypothetical protein
MMRFAIRRVSWWANDPDNSPCASAIWDGEQWYVELGTLEDLMASIDESGDNLIVSRDEIEIYDGYNE